MAVVVVVVIVAEGTFHMGPLLPNMDPRIHTTAMVTVVVPTMDDIEDKITGTETDTTCHRWVMTAASAEVLHQRRCVVLAAPISVVAAITVLLANIDGLDLDRIAAAHRLITHLRMDTQPVRRVPGRAGTGLILSVILDIIAQDITNEPTRSFTYSA
jgi:hypothetical protein